MKSELINDETKFLPVPSSVCERKGNVMQLWTEQVPPSLNVSAEPTLEETSINKLKKLLDMFELFLLAEECTPIREWSEVKEKLIAAKSANTISGLNEVGGRGV